ncbi:MAG: TetR/AcrR family transcriptional regulator [Cyclobacteriaceae bacterium]|nr:TetR/AcrR family transcriptional regulator [Cyclobacteriaceae bacterium]
MDKTQEKIVDSYLRYVVAHNTKPKSISSFAEDIKLTEATFNKYYASFDELEQSFWKDLFEKTLTDISSQEVYANYSVNEKLLSLYYTWIEKLMAYRAYAQYVMKEEKIYELYPGAFATFKIAFEAYVSQLITEGLATEEIANRKFISDKYVYLLWYQPVSIIKFWVKDQSKDFEDTDALIEKRSTFHLT